jgi:hypothetical protein
MHIVQICQGELEHRASKARFARTNRRQFAKQMARIERREARIRRIRQRNFTTQDSEKEKVASCPEAHYVIGKSQKLPWDVSQFVQRNLGDPAI